MTKIQAFITSFSFHLLLLISILSLERLLPKEKKNPLLIDLTNYYIERHIERKDSTLPSQAKKLVSTNKIEENPSLKPLQKREDLEAPSKSTLPHAESESLEKEPLKRELAKELAKISVPVEDREITSRGGFPSKGTSEREVSPKEIISSGEALGKGGYQSQEAVSLDKGEAKESPSEIYLKKNLSVISEIVRKNLTYPYIARKMGWQGNLIITFLLTPKGEIKELQIEKSSGYEVLDKNTIEVIKKTVSLFPQPPVEVKIRLPVRYQLN